MNEKVRAYLEDQKKREEAEKTEFLATLGLAEKEYSDVDTPEYPYMIYDEQKKANVYYKYVSDITDEEYREILKHTKATPDKDGVSTALYIAAILVYVIGGIVALIALDGGILAMLLAVISAFVSGTLFLGLSRIVALLNTLVKKD